NLMCFWAHPEADDHAEYRHMGVKFAIDTRPYPDLLLKTRGYTGFAGLNEGENNLVNPGSAWDEALREYLDGLRSPPPWCFGEMLYHYEGQAGKTLSNVENMLWAPEKTAAALLDSVRKGLFYARINHKEQSLALDRWQVNGFESGRTGHVQGGSVKVSLAVSSKIPGEKLEALVIRNGEVVKKAQGTSPLEIAFEDNLPPGVTNFFYRAVVRGKYPLRLATNPVFIRR
ncbi:MAG: hypothetical protein WC299_14090, partial [Kiritimatiellia bacterium]